MVNAAVKIVQILKMDSPKKQCQQVLCIAKTYTKTPAGLNKQAKNAPTKTADGNPVGAHN